MKFGISIPNNQGVTSVRTLVDIAVTAESQGYDSVWVSEHLFHASYVAQRLDKRPYHEALVVLTAVATATRRVRLGTSVLVLPWHHAARLAKQIASLDQLSEGRVDLGIGVAQAEDEFINLGVPFSERGRITDETIDALRCLWQEDVPAFEGQYYRFSGLRAEPKPVQSPLPILIGGNSARALRRVREKGDGWHALSQSSADMQAACASLPGKRCSARLMLSFEDTPSDKPLDARRTLKGTEEEIREMLTLYEAAGVEEIVIDANTMDMALCQARYARFAKAYLG